MQKPRVLQLLHRWLRRSVPCHRTALALALAVVCAQPVCAEWLPEFNLEVAVFHADLGIEATLLEGNTVRVNKVLMGPVAVGQKLQVAGLLNLSRKALPSKSAIFSLALGKETTPPPDVTGGLVLFLQKHDDGRQWMPVGGASGVKWLVDGKVYGYQLVLSTDGPYSLMPDSEAKTEDELSRVIQAALAKKEKFTAAGSIVDPAGRVAALIPYLQPSEKNTWYFSAAAEQLARAGPLAGPRLRRESQRPNEFYRRGVILRALGKSGDPEAAPFLLAIAERSAAFMKARNPYQEKWLPEVQRAVLNDWNVAIYVLSQMADKRAVPALRDAMLWGVNRHHEIFQSATHGLGRIPEPENVLFFEQAIKSIPGGKNHAAVNDCLRALWKHPFATAVPVLANQLKFPAAPMPAPDPQEQNARLAHAALVQIVGKDLGTGKEAWIKWFDAQPKQDPK